MCSWWNPLYVKMKGGMAVISVVLQPSSEDGKTLKKIMITQSLPCRVSIIGKGTVGPKWKAGSAEDGE